MKKISKEKKKISKETIDKLMLVPIEEIASAMGNTVKRAGVNINMYCPNPNHGSERTPDTYIRRRENIFKCFGGGGCGCKGNSVIAYYGWATFGRNEPSDFYKNVTGAAEILKIEVKFEDGSVRQTPNEVREYKPRPVYELVEAQSDSYCDEFYRKLLDLCPIYENHWNEWTEKRKYSVEDIKRIGLKSIPNTIEEAARVMNALLDAGFSFERVPGFSQVLRRGGNPDNEQDWFWTMARGHYFIPVRNELNQIVRLRINTGNSKRKYIWASTEPNHQLETEHQKMRKGGASSGAPISIAVPTKIIEVWEPGEELTNYFQPKVAIVTEGEHKSLITAKFTDKLVIGLPGSGNFKDLLPMLRKLGVTKLIVAIDIDAFADAEKETGKNENVFKNLRDLSLLALKENTLKDVCMWIWNPQHGKGIDDLILNGYLPIEVNLKTKEQTAVTLPI